MAKTYKGVRKTFLLDCKHMKTFADAPYPRIGEQVLCFRCNDYRRIATGASQTWSWECLSVGCSRQGREYSELPTAHRLALRHYNANPQHRCAVQTNGNTLYVLEGQSTVFEQNQVSVDIVTDLLTK